METAIREFRDRKIFLTSEIEGGNAYDFQKFPGGVYSFTPKRDPGEEYSSQAYYFKFSIENLQKDPTDVTITAIANFDEIWKGWQSSIHPTIWIYSPNHQKQPIRLSSDRVRATPRSMSINLTLRSYETLIISNMLTLSYTKLVNEVENVANEYPTFLKLTEIGRSPLENPIYSIKVNPKIDSSNLFKILIGGTSQPNEFGDYASLLVLQQFLKKGAEFWDDFSTKFSIEFIFFQNPDGMIQGTNMVNSKGENLFFSWDNDRNSSLKENTAIWDYIIIEPPNFYLEMHSFFQDHKTIRPYTFPIELLSEKRDQRLYTKLSKNLIKFSNGMKEEIHIDQPYFKDTLCYQLMEKHQTLCMQYKLHSRNSISHTTQTVWKVFSEILKTLKRR